MAGGGEREQWFMLVKAPIAASGRPALRTRAEAAAPISSHFDQTNLRDPWLLLEEQP